MKIRRRSFNGGRPSQPEHIRAKNVPGHPQPKGPKLTRPKAYP